MKVLIKRNADSFKVGEIDAEEIFNVRWDNISGGVNKRQAGYSLYGNIDYDKASDLVACSGRHGFYNSSAKVMIPANLNKEAPYREGYKYLANLAGEKPRPESEYVARKMPCTKRILEELEDGGVERKVLRDKLQEEGYPVNRIAGALKRMVNDGRIVAQGSPNSPHQLLEICRNRSEILAPNDKEDFIRNIKCPNSSLTIYDSIINTLNAIRSEADRLLAQGHKALAIEYYKWFISRYLDSRSFQLEDLGYSEVKARLEALKK